MIWCVGAHVVALMWCVDVKCVDMVCQMYVITCLCDLCGEQWMCDCVYKCDGVGYDTVLLCTCYGECMGTTMRVHIPYLPYQ